MEPSGIDVPTQARHMCILTEEGGVIERRIRTEGTRLYEGFRAQPRARILLEAATEREWVARCVEGLGHEVIVADPNDAPMDAHRSRWVKTDRRDARALVHACKVGASKPAPRTSDEGRHLRALLSDSAPQT